MRRRLPAGLRWRLLLALVATSAVTLGVTALVVLPPLQDRLRTQSADDLENAVEASRASFQAVFTELDKEPVPSQYDTAEFALWQDRYENELRVPSNDLTRQTDARVLVLDDNMMPGSALESPPGFLYDSEFTSVPPRAMQFALAGMNRPVTELDGDTVYVARTLYTENGATASVLAERELNEVATLVGQVRARFLIAAVVGLLIAGLLAIALSSTLLRRLGRLRAAALRISDEGPDAAMPHDERRDEVGDLARALARMQEELRRQEAARRAFVSTASHELRTPLTMLQGTMELLEEDIRGGQIDELDALRQVDTARRQLDRLSTLSAELLDLSRLDAAVPLRAEPVELGEVVRAVAAEFELRARDRSTSIEVILPEASSLGARRPGRRRPRGPHPARQRAALRPARRAGAGRGAHRRGARGDHGRRPRPRDPGRGAHPHLRALPPRRRRGARRRLRPGAGDRARAGPAHGRRARRRRAAGGRPGHALRAHPAYRALAVGPPRGDRDRVSA